MQPRLASLHHDTPKLTVIEPRGLAVRVVDYHRAAAGETAEAQVNHTAHDPQGRASTLRDPRLFLDASSPANLSTIHSLTGAVVCTVSVDAGLRLGLLGEAGPPVENWDGRGSRRRMQYDGQLRLTALHEQVQDGEDVCAERLSYAANDPAAADHNQCGRLTRHDDPAGTLHFIHYGLTGSVMEHRRHFIDAPVTGFTTSVRLNPLGESLSRTDALGNEQQFAQSLAGHLRSVWLRLSDTTEQTLIVKAIHYNAQDQVEKEVAGNGVVTRLEYCAQSGRLTRLLSQLDQHTPLQELHYAYDPVGNVSSIEDAALPVRYFANQRIEPLNHYRYDSLYRLIDATGWEAGGVDHGPASRASADPAMPGNYRQTYRYDLGNNLLELTHVGPQNHGHRLFADRHSNRCLPVRNGIEPTEEDFRDSFDANGNLRVLHPGQTLSWDLRNQLREVRPVERDGGPSDSEQYAYGADGLRVRKTRSLQTSAQSLLIETLYLPGLKIRTHSGTGEILHVIDVSTGRGSVRVLHWQSGPPEGIANDQQRYSLTDHLGSSTLELDQDGQVITQERYYPFGETAWSSGDAVQVNYKTLRYSGKERDATGLYYYGFRYYVPWLQRWLNPDPAGEQDGLNIIAFVKGNPISYKDVQGLGRVDISNVTKEQEKLVGLSGKQVFPLEAMNNMNVSLGRENDNPVSPVYVEVDEGTMYRLILADRANRFAKTLLPYGSANQAIDLWRTRGLVHPLVESVRNGSGTQMNNAVQEFAGNCGEFSRVAFELLASASSRTDPVYRVGAQGIDHAFVVLGDYRMEGAVYADAWPTFPLAHLADHGMFEISKIYESSGPGYVPGDNYIDEHSLKLAAKKKFPVKVGEKKLNTSLAGVIKEKLERKKIYQQWSSVQGGSTAYSYSSGEVEMFPMLSKNYVRERLEHAVELQKVWRK